MKERIGKYRVIDLIGRDSLTEHYKYSDDESGDLIVVKWVYDEVSSNKQAVDRIKKSVIRFMGLQHKNVMQVRDFAIDGNEVFYTTEYFPGRDVCNLCNSPQPIAEIIPLLSQIADGLAAIHEAKTIHRNIKPETIKISENGKVKIVESIISAAWPIESDEREGVLGELDYVPPEYLENSELTPMGDIWCVGRLGYELVTGQSIYVGQDLIEKILSITKGPPNPTELRDDCPKALAEILMKALAPNKQERYQSATGFGQAVKLLTSS